MVSRWSCPCRRKDERRRRPEKDEWNSWAGHGGGIRTGVYGQRRERNGKNEKCLHKRASIMHVEDKTKFRYERILHSYKKNNNNNTNATVVITQRKHWIYRSKTLHSAVKKSIENARTACARIEMFSKRTSTPSPDDGQTMIVWSTYERGNTWRNARKM